LFVQYLSPVPSAHVEEQALPALNFARLGREMKKGTGHKAARSVHAWWQPKKTADEICAFYNEVVVHTTTPGSYFMVCGFNGGYFGIQDLRNGVHRALFSIWDAGSEMNTGRDDANCIAAADRVIVVDKCRDGTVKRFGGEGTGAQCFDDTAGWNVGEIMCFLVECHSDPRGSARYAAHIRRGHEGPWRQLASYQVCSAKKFGGFYSFIEDFRRDFSSTLEERRAVFGPAWFKTRSGQWTPAVRSKFTASGAEWERPDTIDSDVGPLPCQRVLATGGERLAGAHKLHSCADLCVGQATEPQGACIPGFPACLAPRDLAVVSPVAIVIKCAICARACTGDGPLCGGDCCEAGQCKHVEKGGLCHCVWPRKQIGNDSDPLCLYHSSGGRSCPLCGRPVKGGGPYCSGECCGHKQCQGRINGKGRCPFPCVSGARCHFHASC